MHQFQIKTPYLKCKNNKVYLLNYHEMDIVDYEDQTYYLDDYEVNMLGKFSLNNLDISYSVSKLENDRNLLVNVSIHNIDNLNNIDNALMIILVDNIQKYISGLEI